MTPRMLTELLPPVGDWREQALCAQVDSELFFPDKGGSPREPKQVCSECPVRSQCLEYALAHDERYGVWGGLSERERRRVKRQRVAAPAGVHDGLRHRGVPATVVHAGAGAR